MEIIKTASDKFPLKFNLADGETADGKNMTVSISQGILVFDIEDQCYSIELEDIAADVYDHHKELNS